MQKNPKRKFSAIEILAIFLSSLGLVLLIWFYFSLWSNLKIDGKAQFGDLVGGVIGSLWAFAGILLFYSALRLQKNEFSLQREEFVLQRIEFVLNRITNIIYKQKETLDKIFSNENIVFTEVSEKFYGKNAIDFIVNEISLFNNDVLYEELSVDKREIIERGRRFVYTSEMEEVLYSIYSSLRLVEDYIEDKYEEDSRKEQFILSESDKKHLYRLASSTLNFNELNRILFAIKTYVFFWEQEKMFGAPIYDKWSRINKMVNFSLELIMKIKRKKLLEVDTFSRRESIMDKNRKYKRVMYTG